MHHIYHTEAIILGSKNFGEAGRYYYLLTRELGLVYASAQGVRKMSSKLRYVLQDFAYVNVDLVQGKDFWRITTATKTNELETLSKSRSKLVVVANVSRLLRRLLAGIEPNEELFTDFIEGLLVLEKAENRDELANIEAVLVLRIVNNLGYIGENEELSMFTKSPFASEVVMKVGTNRRMILQEINKALKETQL